MPSSKSQVVIISPALEAANNGNWRTAQRWHRFLAGRYATTVVDSWTADPGGSAPDLLIALHARRSADSIARFAEAFPGRPLVLVMTGTDIYRDIAVDASAQASLKHATRIVLLEPEGLAQLPFAVRDKVTVIVQSAPMLKPRSPDPRWFDLLMVAHLRDEKDPETTWRAFERVSRNDLSVRLTHVGDTLDPRFDAEARLLAERNPRYLRLGALSHARTRQQIRRARALVISSRIEGGAHVLIEAVTSSVPVLASAIPGNIGLLGRNYAGTFPVGDAAALATLIERARRDAPFLALLRRQCAERAPLFRPEQERKRLITLVASCLSSPVASSVAGPDALLP